MGVVSCKYCVNTPRSIHLMNTGMRLLSSYGFCSLSVLSVNGGSIPHPQSVQVANVCADIDQELEPTHLK